MELGMWTFVVGAAAFGLEFVAAKLREWWEKVNGRSMPHLPRYVLGVSMMVLPVLVYLTAVRDYAAMLVVFAAVVGAGSGTFLMYGGNHFTDWLNKTREELRQSRMDAAFTKAQAKLYKEQRDRSGQHDDAERT